MKRVRKMSSVVPPAKIELRQLELPGYDLRGVEAAAKIDADGTIHVLDKASGRWIAKGRVHDASVNESRVRERNAALAHVHEKHPWLTTLPSQHVSSAQRAMLLVERVVGVVALCIPRRIINEEVGDACEVIAQHFNHSSALWPAYVKLVTTVFWIVVHTVEYFASQLRGSRKASGE